MEVEIEKKRNKYLFQLNIRSDELNLDTVQYLLGNPVVCICNFSFSFLFGPNFTSLGKPEVPETPSAAPDILITS